MTREKPTESITRLPGSSPFEDVAGYCRAVRSGRWITVSGTAAAADPEASDLGAETYRQTVAAFESGLAAIRDLGGAPAMVVRTRMLLAPEADWREASRAHSTCFDAVRPANTTVYIARLIPPGALVEIEVDAYLTDAASSEGQTGE